MNTHDTYIRQVFKDFQRKGGFGTLEIFANRSGTDSQTASHMQNRDYSQYGGKTPRMQNILAQMIAVVIQESPDIISPADIDRFLKAMVPLPVHRKDIRLLVWKKYPELVQQVYLPMDIIGDEYDLSSLALTPKHYSKIRETCNALIDLIEAYGKTLRGYERTRLTPTDEHFQGLVKIAQQTLQVLKDLLEILV